MIWSGRSPRGRRRPGRPTTTLSGIGGFRPGRPRAGAAVGGLRRSRRRSSSRRRPRSRRSDDRDRAVLDPRSSMLRRGTCGRGRGRSPGSSGCSRPSRPAVGVALEALVDRRACRLCTTAVGIGAPARVHATSAISSGEGTTRPLAAVSIAEGARYRWLGPSRSSSSICPGPTARPRRSAAGRSASAPAGGWERPERDRPEQADLHPASRGPDRTALYAMHPAMMASDERHLGIDQR